MMKPLPLALMAGAVAVSAIALAADQRFEAADRDGDGLLSMAEVILAMPEATPDAFNDADADDSGALTEEEFTAATSEGLLPQG